MQQMYGYIRVSTVRQGVHGVSLQEQKTAIEQYAGINDLKIVEWFEERETAAKLGRPVFSRMIQKLRQRKVSGVVIHKIDRSARNLKDWAALGELLDSGIDVRFAHDSLDLHARGGRLSADIQAVIAADYIRNLREETKKGFYGRLKQGFYPMRAPLGYLDQGAGKPKIPDPIKAPIVKRIFRMYANGKYSLDQLVKYLDKNGFKNRDGGNFSRNGLSTILHNPFYIGLMYIHRTGETFTGNHEPLITKSLFDTVQEILNGKKKKVVKQHDFLFRRTFICQICKRSYIGEKQKGLNYYRCHSCKNSCLREEILEERLRKTFVPLLLCPDDLEEASQMVEEMKESRMIENETIKDNALLRYDKCKSHLDRLTDAYVDNVIDKEIYLRRKESILKEMKDIEEAMQKIDNEEDHIGKKVTERIELLKSLYLGYSKGTYEQKRYLIKSICSNQQINGKNVIVELKTPFKELAEFMKISQGTPRRATSRRLESLSEKQKNSRSKLNKRKLRKIYRILAKDLDCGKGL